MTKYQALLTRLMAWLQFEAECISIGHNTFYSKDV